ncbi:hypothetical protein [Methanogenium cariaci]|uniref:hypothetical protein n=1 Tax=Methanogenium cariaci TaxID=2197 RepID=UPI00155DDB74|nr:hypothetical protein [Methanogenium cariaci]
MNKRLILYGGYDAGGIDGRVSLTADGTILIGCMVVSGGVWVESDNNILEGVLTGWYIDGSHWIREGFIVWGGSHNTFTNCIVDGFFLGGRRYRHDHRRNQRQHVHP